MFDNILACQCEDLEGRFYFREGEWADGCSSPLAPTPFSLYNPVGVENFTFTAGNLLRQLSKNCKAIDAVFYPAT